MTAQANHLFSNAISQLQMAIETAPAQLKQIDTAEFNLVPGPGKWSKKEILGHLIDSASNNHQRFIRAQFENKPLITYNQNAWNAAGHYLHYEKNQLIEFWTHYNLHILTLIKSMDHDALSKEIQMTEQVSDLYAIFIDYVAHLEHHLKQILEVNSSLK